MKTLSEIDGGNHKYLGEVFEDLPDNIIFNKVMTGCGMTTLALDNKVMYVVTVPYINIIVSKLEWAKLGNAEVLGVYNKEISLIQNDDIVAYTGNKIICTYDSLQRVVEALEKRGDIKDWKVLVDECQKLVDAGSFRSGVISKVVDNYLKFGAFVMGTATPVKQKYQLPALKQIPIVKMKWNNIEKVNVTQTIYEKDLLKVVAILALGYLNGENGKDNAHIFINSVGSIIKVVEIIRTQFSGAFKDIRIVCADKKLNHARINNALGKSYRNQAITSDVKRVNFYTSTAFEGCDIFDEYGRTYIVSDGSKDISKIDILSTLPQIVGRIRDSRYKNLINMLYTKTPIMARLTEEAYEKTVTQTLVEAAQCVEAFNATSDIGRSMMTKGVEDDAAVIYEENTLKVNESYWCSQMNAFATLHLTYYVHKSTGLCQVDISERDLNGTAYAFSKGQQVKVVGLVKANLGLKPNFAELCVDYIELRDSGGELAKLTEIDPVIKDAYEVLGAPRMKALSYVKVAIKKELLIANTLLLNSQKLVKLLGFKKLDFCSLEEAKDRLQGTYDALHIKKKAKVSDLGEWYEYRKARRGKREERVCGVEIILCKVK